MGVSERIEAAAAMTWSLPHLLGSSASSRGAEEMDETLHRFTRLSVPPLSNSWSWQRLYLTVDALLPYTYKLEKA